MHFPDDATPVLFYRNTIDGSVNSLSFSGDLRYDDMQADGFQLEFNVRNSTLRPLLRRRRGGDVYLERLELSMQSDSLQSITLDEGLPISAKYRIFQHGFQSWSLSQRRTHRDRDRFVILKWKHAMDENPETPLQTKFPFRLPLHMFPARGRFHSEGLVALEEVTDDVPARLVYSTAAPGRQYLRFRVRLDPRTARLIEFTVIWDFQGRLFVEHGRESLTPLRWSVQLPGDRSRHATRAETNPNGLAVLLDRHMRVVSHEFRDRPQRPEGIIGWCSWYYYYTHITEEIIRKNLHNLTKSPLKVDLFQIDDGYQAAIGDWLNTNNKFPSGMKVLAEEIKSAGMTPGIWLAPVIVQKSAKLFSSHPNFVLRDRKGKPVRALYNPLWGGWAYTFDVTNPTYIEWLSETIHTIVHDWGYSYLKLDFLFPASFRGAHANHPYQTGAERMHNLLQLIRKVAGNKTFLLGCGCPIFPAIGAFDAMRIGMDVNHIWSGNFISRLLRDRNFPTAHNSLINTITRSFMHNRFWINDPDCLMVRTTRTKLSDAQTILMASVMSVSGGMLLLSDDLEELPEERFSIFQRAAEINRRCARYTPLPLGLMTTDFPRGLYNRAGYIGLWNPDARPANIKLGFPPGISRNQLRGRLDFWTGETIPWRLEEDHFMISLAPFESMIAVL